MAIYDRDWYRQGRRRTPGMGTSAVRGLIIANVICFVLTIFAKNAGWDPAHEGLGMVPDDVVKKFMIWQIFTSMFLHGDLMHLLFNMLFLWMFGTPVEARLGPKTFLRFYLGAGVVAGLAYVMFGILNERFAPAVGASGAVMGVLVYFTCLNPNAIVHFLLIVPMRMKWATAIIIGIDLYWFVLGPRGVSNIAHTAHLGGALYGFLYFRLAHRIDRFFLDLEMKARSRTETRDRRSREELQAEVDRLLDKVHRSGLESLTDAERKFLTDASRRLREDR